MENIMRNIQRKGQQFLFAYILILMVPPTSWGQSDTGTISGTVTDTSGSVVAKANVTVTDAKTNTAVFTTSTDANGYYIAIALKPSDYVISAELAGFERCGGALRCK